jgi:hypothetical protein
MIEHPAPAFHKCTSTASLSAQPLRLVSLPTRTRIFAAALLGPDEEIDTDCDGLDDRWDKRIDNDCEVQVEFADFDRS